MTDGEIIERAEEVFALYGGDDVTQADLDRMNRLLRIGAKVVAADDATVERVARALWKIEGVAYGWNENERRRYTWEQSVELDLAGVGVFRIFSRAALASVGE